MVAWGISQNSPFGLKKKKDLNISNSTNSTQPTDKHVWEIWVSEHLRWANRRSLGGGLERHKGAAIHSWSFLQDEGEGRFYCLFFALWSLEQCCLSEKQIPCSGAQWSGKRAGQRLSMEGPQPCLSNHHCQAGGCHRTWPCLHRQSRACAPTFPPAPIFPELVPPKPRGICATSIETYSIASSRDRSGNIHAR